MSASQIKRFLSLSLAFAISVTIPTLFVFADLPSIGSCVDGQPPIAEPKIEGYNGILCDPLTNTTACNSDGYGCIPYATPPSGSYKKWSIITPTGDCITTDILEHDCYKCMGGVICAVGYKYPTYGDCSSSSTTNRVEMWGWTTGGCI